VIDHVDIRVSDLAVSRAFYLDVLGPPTVDDADFIEWGDFGIVDASDEEPLTRRLHVAVVVQEETDCGCLVDPDGNTLEAVHDETSGVGAILHVRLRTRDVAAAKRFYEIVVGNSGGAVSFVASDEPTQNVHLAFGVPDFDAVVRFHEAALAAGYRDNGPPGERPQYHPGYYGAFVLDPDGNNVEAVFHDRS